MEDRHEEIVKQYDFKVHNTYRARGALLLDTDKGVKLYKGFEGSRNRLEFENRIKAFLMDKGYKNVDLTLPNQKGELVSEDTVGGKYIVKNWFLGEECNLKDIKDVALAADNLGKLHNILCGASIEREPVYLDNENLLEVFQRHNRELKRVRAYIRGKKQKNEFEVGIMNSFTEFYEQAEEATMMLQELEYPKIFEKSKLKGTVSHGSYTYHNVLIQKGIIATTNFEKACIGVQIFDLYYFLRKAMEKSDWKLSCGNTILESYDRCSSISEKDRKLLYILCLYPEKYWKITNFYYNGKKSWISKKNMQKLNSVREQNAQRCIFLEKLRSLSF